MTNGTLEVLQVVTLNNYTNTYYINKDDSFNGHRESAEGDDLVNSDVTLG